jgi:hypothetical protein
VLGLHSAAVIAGQATGVLGLGKGLVGGQGSAAGSGFIHTRSIAGNTQTQGAGAVDIAHGLVGAKGEGSAYGEGFVHALPVVAGGGGYAQGAGAVNVGHLVGAQGEGSVHGSGVVHTRGLPKIVAAGQASTYESGHLDIGHGLVGVAGEGSAQASGGIKVSRGVVVDSHIAADLREKVKLGHDSIATAGHVDTSADVLVTRAGGLAPLSAVLEGMGQGSTVDKLNLGKGLGLNSASQGSGSILGAVHSRDISATGAGDFHVGKVVNAQGAGFAQISKTGIVTAGEGSLKAGPVVAEGAGFAVAH